MLIPTWAPCARKINRREPTTALEQFVFHWGETSEDWSTMLSDALDEAYDRAVGGVT